MMLPIHSSNYIQLKLYTHILISTHFFWWYAFLSTALMGLNYSSSSAGEGNCELSVFKLFKADQKLKQSNSYLVIRQSLLQANKLKEICRQAKTSPYKPNRSRGLSS